VGGQGGEVRLGPVRRGQPSPNAAGGEKKTGQLILRAGLSCLRVALVVPDHSRTDYLPYRFVYQIVYGVPPRQYTEDRVLNPYRSSSFRAGDGIRTHDVQLGKRAVTSLCQRRKPRHFPDVSDILPRLQACASAFLRLRKTTEFPWLWRAARKMRGRFRATQKRAGRTGTVSAERGRGTHRAAVNRFRQAEPTPSPLHSFHGGSGRPSGLNVTRPSAACPSAASAPGAWPTPPAAGPVAPTAARPAPG
jgi:hypothetical protein